MFFGATADAVGSREIELKTEENTAASSLANDLTRQYPLLSGHKLLIAVNEEYAGDDTTLSEGDEVAVFTAVSGG